MPSFRNLTKTFFTICAITSFSGFGALGFVAAIFALLYFTGLIKLRRQEHKDWKH